MALSLVTAPASEPVTLLEAKTHLRVTVDDDNDYIAGLIQAAREHCETFTHRALITQTWTLRMDGFPCGYDRAIEIPKPPLQSIGSVTYVDTDGNTQTWSSALYQVDAPSGQWAMPGRLLPAYFEIYPVTRQQMNAVAVTFTAGYGAAKDVPASIKAAMKLLIGNWYRNREAGQIVRGSSDVLPFGIDQLLWQFKAF